MVGGYTPVDLGRTFRKTQPGKGHISVVLAYKWESQKDKCLKVVWINRFCLYLVRSPGENWGLKVNELYLYNWFSGTSWSKKRLSYYSHPHPLGKGCLVLVVKLTHVASVLSTNSIVGWQWPWERELHVTFSEGNRPVCFPLSCPEVLCQIAQFQNWGRNDKQGPLC
jgi:hypothetical protein